MSLFTTADLTSLRNDRLVTIMQTYFPDVTLSDDYLMQKIYAAEKDVSRQLKVLFEPTVIFPYEPTQEEITALNGDPYIEEPGYDYDSHFFQGDRWGYIVTRQHPIISVEFVRMVYPDARQAFYTIPQAWLRLDKKYGHIRMVPASQTFVAPLGAFLMQALGGGSSIPSMIQVKYVAGLTDARDEWPDLIDVILKTAVLKTFQDGLFPSSESISADGLSQSRSVKIQDYEDMVNTKLFGPKGSNGGLWTAIHGIPMGVVGVLA